jgi:sugar (pentulose or hexulose) kinase
LRDFSRRTKFDCNACPIRPARAREPDAARREVYAQQFGVYKGLYPALKDSMHRLRGEDA